MMFGFSTAVTALNQMRAAQNLGIQTFALWRLGSEDRTLWGIWDSPGEANAVDKLKDVPPGQDVDMEGTGEILKHRSAPDEWKAVTFTVDVHPEQITDESFDTCRAYRVARYGSSNNQVCPYFR